MPGYFRDQAGKMYSAFREVFLSAHADRRSQVITLTSTGATVFVVLCMLAYAEVLLSRTEKIDATMAFLAPLVIAHFALSAIVVSKARDDVIYAPPWTTRVPLAYAVWVACKYIWRSAGKDTRRSRANSSSCDAPHDSYSGKKGARISFLEEDGLAQPQEQTHESAGILNQQRRYLLPLYYTIFGLLATWFFLPFWTVFVRAMAFDQQLFRNRLIWVSVLVQYFVYASLATTVGIGLVLGGIAGLIFRKHVPARKWPLWLPGRPFAGWVMLAAVVKTRMSTPRVSVTGNMRKMG
jgi:hypothetical protein